MYYIRIDNEDSNSLVYYCRNCGNEDKFMDIQSSCIQQNQNKTNCVCILKTDIKKNDKNYNNIINQYTKLDPTLPRTNKIDCPNPNCDTNKSKKDKEIIYERYDDVNMKYIYLCTSCDTTWKTFEEV
jgi:hypothetical protein